MGGYSTLVPTHLLRLFVPQWINGSCVVRFWDKFDSCMYCIRDNKIMHSALGWLLFIAKSTFTILYFHYYM